MNKLVIAMSRQFDTGGHLVGEKVAEYLNMKFYDGEMIADIVAAGGLKNYDYKGCPAPNHSFKGHYEWMPKDQAEFDAQADVIRELAEEGNCVICGRCADFLLRNQENCVRLFIRADFDYRVGRFMKAYNMPAEGIREKYRVLDAGRAAYYKLYTGEDWAQLDQFNLVIDTTLTGPVAAADVVMAYLKAAGKID